MNRVDRDGACESFPENQDLAIVPNDLPRQFQLDKLLSRWMEVHRQFDAHITTGEELSQRRAGSRLARTLLAGRLGLWHGPIPTGVWTGLLSSRLGRRLETRPEWFHALRTACLHIKTKNEVLVTGAKTTTARFASLATRLFHLRSLTMNEAPRGQTFSRWLKQRQHVPAVDNVSGQEVWISPQLIKRTDSLGGVPDWLVAALADQLFVLQMRRGGNIERLVRTVLESSSNGTAKVFLACNSDLIDREVYNAFLDMGAEEWTLPENCQEIAAALVHRRSQPEPIVAQAVHISRANILPKITDKAWPFLTHCTRAPCGPWPDESDDEYVTNLLTQVDLSERTPFVALSRIVRQQRLVASGRGIRGGVPVVCWSEIPLSKLLEHRVYRSHRIRWDFEPYGLCVDREWLFQRGARPVIYGNERDWQDLVKAERPFYQMRAARGRRSGNVYDWSVEKEWRLVGDLNLDQLPSDAGRLFVPTQAEAEQLAELSPWPIVVVAKER